MNVIEAYLKYKGFHVILISGYSGSNKTVIGEFIANKFKYLFVNLSKFYYSLEEYDKKENYEHYWIDHKKTYILNWNNVYKSVNWSKFNDFINEHKSKGVVVAGFGFPAKSIDFTATHIYIKVYKDNLLERREKYMKEHNKPFDKDIELNNVIIEDQITMKIRKDSVYDWTINANKLDFEEVKQDAFRYIINDVSGWLKKYSSEKTPTNETNIETEKKKSKNPPMLYEDKVYSKFYYPKNKNKLYDVNNQGYPYPEEFREEYNKKYILSRSSSDSSDTSSNTSSST